uniref:Transporter associated with antigen processing, subunit type t, teleost specific n=1 Tax=Denticeps clupeoides TaxID=299321 RepID=A0AAY4B0S2_9TELE
VRSGPVRSLELLRLSDLATGCVVVLGLDALLWTLAGFLLVQSECASSSSLLAWLWTFRVLSWVLLHSVVQVVSPVKECPALKRWVATLCLVTPVYESLKAMVPLSQAHNAAVPDPGKVILAALASCLACLLWEWVFTGDGRARGDATARALLMRAMRYSAPDYLHLGAAFLFLTLTAVCETYMPYYIGKVVDILSHKYEYSTFMWAIVCMGLFSLGSSLFGGLRGGMFMCSLCRMNKRVRHMLFQSLMKQDISFFEENKPGSLSSRLISDTDKMGRSVAMNLNVLLRSVVKTVGMLWFMLGLSWQLTGLTCLEMPLLALLQNSYNSYSQLQDSQAETKELASEIIFTMKTVRSFNAEENEWRRYQGSLEKTRQIRHRKGIYSATHLLLRRMVTLGLKVLMLLQGRQLIASNLLSMGNLLSFILYQKDMVTNMRQLVYIYGDMLNTVTASVKVFQLLDRKPKMKEVGHLAPPNLEGKINFCNVSFFYPSRPDILALKGVTFEVHAGKMTALVGPSGGGKSSCVNLLERFYEASEGEVLLDGEPIHQYQHQYLHRKMAMVSQDPVLFSGSVRHNIEYGQPGCSMDMVEDAARRANAHNFICKLEQGYATDVGECGGQLSAGEKQCIAIARALVCQPLILILDEATSSMDINTQHAVQDVLAGKEGQTVLVVAHRLQTVEKADHIIFLQDGEVVEQGTHQQLMESRGQYHRLREEPKSCPRMSETKL